MVNPKVTLSTIKFISIVFISSLLLFGIPILLLIKFNILWVILTVSGIGFLITLIFLISQVNMLYEYNKNLFAKQKKSEVKDGI